LKGKQIQTIFASIYCCMPDKTIVIYAKCFDITQDFSPTYSDTI